MTLTLWMVVISIGLVVGLLTAAAIVWVLGREVRLPGMWS